ANISNIQNPCHIFFASSKTFNVILTVTSDKGCQSTVILPSTVDPLPVANFQSTSPCLGEQSQFTDISNAFGDTIVSWNWNFSDGTPGTSVVSNPSTTYLTAGSHTVILIVATSKGCIDTVSLPVIVHNNPVVNFGGNVQACAPVCTQFLDSSQAIDGNIVTWQWSFPGGTPSSSYVENPTTCYNTPGHYGVTLLVTTNYGCQATLTKNSVVYVYPWPTADFNVSPLQASVNDPVFAFFNLWSSDVVKWYWNFGDSSPIDSIRETPVHSYSYTVTNNDFYSYTISIYVKNQFGCWDTIARTIEILPEFSFYIPNCFTPNNDFVNEMFFGKGRGIKEYKIWLFDRWGNMIWSCDYKGKNIAWDKLGQDGMPAACQWDGKVEAGMTNEVVQQDVYVWKVQLTDIFDKKHNYIGHVSVVR
ncbi:MAG: PKD domain-containing protein, partial [Bacteroidota bacterium]